MASVGALPWAPVLPHEAKQALKAKGHLHVRMGYAHMHAHLPWFSGPLSWLCQHGTSGRQAAPLHQARCLDRAQSTSERTMVEPRPRRWLWFACCLLHMEDWRAGELLMATARLRVTAVVPTGWAHGCEERNYFFKGRKIPNGPFSVSVHIIVVSKLMKGLACWLAEYPLMLPPAPHVERLRHHRGTQTPVGRWERVGREVGKA